MKLKRAIALLGVTAMLTTSLCGCGGPKDTTKTKELDGNKVVLTVGDETVKLSEAYFLFKLQQANYQNIIAYNGNYGDDWYAQDIFGTGESFQDYFKDYYMELLTRVCLARQKMNEYGIELSAKEKSEIDETAKKFIESNSDETLLAMLTDEETVRQTLTDYKILEKVAAKAVEGVNTETTDEELKTKAYTRTYDYIYISFETKDEEGNLTLLSAAEQEEYMNQLGIIRAQTIESGDFDAAAEAAGQTVSSHTYTPGATASEDRLYEINNEMDKLQIGEISDVIALDTTGIILAYMASDNTDELEDEEVLSKAKDEIIADRKLEMFKNAITEWKAGCNIEVDQELWDKVTMEKPLAAKSSKK